MTQIGRPAPTTSRVRTSAHRHRAMTAGIDHFLVKPVDPVGLQELLGGGVSSLETTRRTYNFRYPSPEHFVGWFREYYGPTVRAFAALDTEGQDALAGDLKELCEAHNVSGDGTLVVPSDYLEAVAIRG